MRDQITAIVFDYGNVIASFDPNIFVRGIGPFTPLSPGALKQTLKASSHLFTAFETGNIDSQRLYKSLSVACSLTATQDQFEEAYVNMFTPILTTMNLISRLRHRYKLGLLSNTNEWHFHRQIQPNPVFPFFTAVTLSFRLNAVKPEQKLYFDILQQLQVEPHRCVYIDDVEEYAVAATGLGMIGIRYVSHDQLLQSLKSVGVIIPE